MAKKQGGKPETKSAFLRRVLQRNPGLELRQVNQRWAKAGHDGEISNALYYQVRAKLGIRTEWVWMKNEPKIPGISASQHSTDEVYQFKITLLETEPPIWRRIQVPDGSLDTLHEQIQTAMGWTNSHLHQFKIEGTIHGDPMLLVEPGEEFPYKNSLKIRLSEIVPKSGEPLRFEYEYDFGDSWLHEVVFEGLSVAEPSTRYPVCTEGARACPPEDVGGVWSYQHFLEVVADRKHPEREQLLRWAGRKFNPDAFSPAAATRRMHKGLPDWRRMV